jgi:hypothetical protein
MDDNDELVNIEEDIDNRHRQTTDMIYVLKERISALDKDELVKLVTNLHGVNASRNQLDGKMSYVRDNLDDIKYDIGKRQEVEKIVLELVGDIYRQLDIIDDVLKNIKTVN